MFIIFFSFFGFHFLILFLWQFVTHHPLPVTRYPSPATGHLQKSPAVITTITPFLQNFFWLENVKYIDKWQATTRA